MLQDKELTHVLLEDAFIEAQLNYAFICLISPHPHAPVFCLFFTFSPLNIIVLCCATTVWGRTAAAVPTTRSPWPSSSSTTPLCCTWKRSPSSWPLSASCEKKASSVKVNCQGKSVMPQSSFGLIWLMVMWPQVSFLPRGYEFKTNTLKREKKQRLCFQLSWNLGHIRMVGENWCRRSGLTFSSSGPQILTRAVYEVS